MFPETYGRTLEELAFLFEDRALAEEATAKVEKQMEWSEQQRWSSIDARMSWDMEVMVPKKGSVGRRDHVDDASSRTIRGERGGWWYD
jgi:hypothetical protein